jgi:hypothetical protein
VSKFAVILFAVALTFLLPVRAMEFNPSGGDVESGTVQTIDIIFDKPALDNYTTVNVNLDISSHLFWPLIRGFLMIPACVNGQSFSTGKVCFTVATASGAFADGTKWHHSVRWVVQVQLLLSEMGMILSR